MNAEYSDAIQNKEVKIEQQKIFLELPQEKFNEETQKYINQTINATSQNSQLSD